MGFLLLVPFLLIRFGLLGLLDKTAIGRAAHFAPMERAEMPALVVYQLSNLGIFIYMCFLRIRPMPRAVFYAGLAVLALGSLLLVLAMVGFAAPAASGFRQTGFYRVSRNPIYVAYFVYFTGCVLLTQSWVLLVVVCVFQLSTHWVIRAEERWCIEQFGDDYRAYMKRVRRYI